MKNKEEYINSIYKKRDEALKLRKKRRSYLTAAVCIAVCFLTVFFIVPKNSFKVKSDPNNELQNSYDRFIYETPPEEHTTLPVADSTIGFVEETESFRENKTTAYFGASNTLKTESVQSCTVASSVPQQTAPSSTVKPTKTTTKKNPHKNNTNTNDVIGAGDSIIDVEDVIDGLDYILSDSIKWPEFTTRGNILQGFEGSGKPSTSKAPTTTEKPAAPDTGGDDYSGVLDAAHSYLSENELKEIDPSKTDISIEVSPSDSTSTEGSSSHKFAYYVVFQTDKKTIIIILDNDTLEFLGRKEQPLTKIPVESTTAPQTTTAPASTTKPTSIAESALTTATESTTTVTQAVTENN